MARLPKPLVKPEIKDIANVPESKELRNAFKLTDVEKFVISERCYDLIALQYKSARNVVDQIRNEYNVDLSNDTVLTYADNYRQFLIQTEPLALDQRRIDFIKGLERVLIQADKAIDKIPEYSKTAPLAASTLLNVKINAFNQLIRVLGIESPKQTQLSGKVEYEISYNNGSINSPNVRQIITPEDD